MAGDLSGSGAGRVAVVWEAGEAEFGAGGSLQGRQQVPVDVLIREWCAATLPLSRTSRWTGHLRVLAIRIRGTYPINK